MKNSTEVCIYQKNPIGNKNVLYVLSQSLPGGPWSPVDPTEGDITIFLGSGKRIKIEESMNLWFTIIVLFCIFFKHCCNSE